MRVLPLLLILGCAQAATVSRSEGPGGFAGWESRAPRAEIAPRFSTDPAGGPEGKGCLVIAAEEKGQQGCWTRNFPVSGFGYARFTAWKRITGAATPRRSGMVQITWQDDRGRLVFDGEDMARPVYPADRRTEPGGWTVIEETYRVPVRATRAEVQLHLRWAPKGRVEWSTVSLTKVDGPPTRKVKLAAVHYRPKGGKTPADNRRQFAPFIAEAAQRGADLVVLPEYVTYQGLGLKYPDVAEPIPGPSTEYFGKLAKKHDLYIAAGILERAGTLVYNAAILVGPDGALIGKYRKVCPARGEAQGGITPGDDFPVFETRFGKVGMMVCWDVHFPEVARNLASRGAEVIALPIAGGMPTLARARAVENQVYLVSSTYTDHDRDWMKTGVWAPSGELLDHAKQWGTVVVSEVDLARHHLWRHIGDFKSRVFRELPGAGFRK